MDNIDIQSDFNENTYWKAVQDKTTAFDGHFVYAVLSTNIYCRPSCPSKRPKRQHVKFYNSIKEAELAGFRPCKRCSPKNINIFDQQLLIIEKTCYLLEKQLDNLPTLNKIGLELNISSFHLHRTFKKILGITPYQYASLCRVNNFRENIKKGKTLTSSIYDAGYGSSSRLYEKAKVRLGMTPYSYVRGGLNIDIYYVTFSCSLGQILMAISKQGVCSIYIGDNIKELEENLYIEFFAAKIFKGDFFLENTIKTMLEFLDKEYASLNLPIKIKTLALKKRILETYSENSSLVLQRST